MSESRPSAGIALLASSMRIRLFKPPGGRRKGRLMATEGAVGGREAGIIPRRVRKGQIPGLRVSTVRFCAIRRRGTPRPSAAAVSTRTPPTHGRRSPHRPPGATLASRARKGAPPLARLRWPTFSRRGAERSTRHLRRLPAGLRAVLDLRVEGIAARCRGAGLSANPKPRAHRSPPPPSPEDLAVAAFAELHRERLRWRPGDAHLRRRASVRALLAVLPATPLREVAQDPRPRGGCDAVAEPRPPSRRSTL